MQQRLYFLRKLKSFKVDHLILQMFYKSVVQSILTFCLICVFGNMRSLDQAKLGRVVKHASNVIGIQQEFPDDLYRSLLCNKVKGILLDRLHPLHCKFQQSFRSNRLLQRTIRTRRYGSSFVPAAIRWYNELLGR